MHPLSPTPAEEAAATAQLAQRAKALQLTLDAAALERVAQQWQRLEAMALLVSAIPLDVTDEPAMTFVS